MKNDISKIANGEEKIYLSGIAESTSRAIAHAIEVAYDMGRKDGREEMGTSYCKWCVNSGDVRECSTCKRAYDDHFVKKEEEK